MPKVKRVQPINPTCKQYISQSFATTVNAVLIFSEFERTTKTRQ